MGDPAGRDRHLHARAALDSYRAAVRQIPRLIEETSHRFGSRRYPHRRSGAVPSFDAGYRCCYLSRVSLEVPYEVRLLMETMQCSEAEVAQRSLHQWLRRVPRGDVVVAEVPDHFIHPGLTEPEMRLLASALEECGLAPGSLKAVEGGEVVLDDFFHHPLPARVALLVLMQQMGLALPRGALVLREAGVCLARGIPWPAGLEEEEEEESGGGDNTALASHFLCGGARRVFVPWTILPACNRLFVKGFQDRVVAHLRSATTGASSTRQLRTVELWMLKGSSMRRRRIRRFGVEFSPPRHYRRRMDCAPRTLLLALGVTGRREAEEAILALPPRVLRRMEERGVAPSPSIGF